VVSNEGRELNAHRIQTFKLAEFVDCFVSSCYVHLRKPDADIYRLALDVSQTPADEILCIDDRALFVEVASGLGIRGIVHKDCDSTRAALALHGLG
jgi:putative hydrolase of the HAD superfamily